MLFIKKTSKSIIFFALCLTMLMAPDGVFGLNNLSAEERTPAENLSYVVKLHAEADVARLESNIAITNIQRVFEQPLLGPWYSFSSSLDMESIENIMKEYASGISANHTIWAAAAYNDPWYTVNGSDANKQWGLGAAGFPNAWEKTVGKREVIVAVIDTGIDYTHEDLANANILPAYDTELRREIDSTKNTDTNGHGTLVAGVIAATAGNGVGIAGAAHGVSILPIRALDKDGNGTSASVSSAIVWAADKGAHIINLSLGGLGFSYDTVLSGAVEYAYRKGVVIVAAAGNDAVVTGGSLDENPVFPICDDNGENMVLGVTAIDVQGLKPGFANFGKSCIDVAAPGRRIISTISRDPLSGSSAPNSYAYVSGTSMAVPFATSQAALLKSINPNATPRQVMDRIITTAEQVDQLNLSQCAGFSCKGLLGAGRINVAKSLDQPLLPKVGEGDLVSDQSGAIFAIVGGKRRPVVPFVFEQRFKDKTARPVSGQDLSLYPEGPPLEPIDGTLVRKSGDDPTVYYIAKGIRMPVTYQIFVQRGFRFSDVIHTAPETVNAWVSGSFLPPVEGTLVKAAAPTVYWVVGGSLHPINYNFWKDRGLDIFPILSVSNSDLKNFPLGEAYVR